MMRGRLARRAWLAAVSLAGMGLASPSSAANDLQRLAQWDFAQPGAGRPGAPPASRRRPPRPASRGLLALDAQVYDTPAGQPACPLAAAEVALGDARLRKGQLARLAIDIEVKRWALGLGRFDDDVPRLELVYRGQRHQLGLSGFKAMPGTVRVEWTAAAGLVASYDGVRSARPSKATPDAGHRCCGCGSMAAPRAWPSRCASRASPSGGAEPSVQGRRAAMQAAPGLRGQFVVERPVVLGEQAQVPEAPLGGGFGHRAGLLQGPRAPARRTVRRKAAGARPVTC
jgi:hypothetical protein